MHFARDALKICRGMCGDLNTLFVKLGIYIIAEFIELLYHYRNECQMCRQTCEGILTVNRVITSDNAWQILMDYHRRCRFNNQGPVTKKYLADLGENWMQLVHFMYNAMSNPKIYKDVQGIEGLNFDKHEVEGRLLEKGESHAVFETTQGKTQVLFCCLFPRISLRLLISPNEDNDVEEDNNYADEAVGYMTNQLTACWKAFASLINKDSIDHLLVRKFKNVTCYLLLSGVHDIELLPYYETPMKEQLGKLKKQNFNSSHFYRIRNSFPCLKRIKVVPQDLGYCLFGGFSDAEDEDECNEEDDYDEECEDEDDCDEECEAQGECDVGDKEKTFNDEVKDDVVVEKRNLNVDVNEEKVDEADNDAVYYIRKYTSEKEMKLIMNLINSYK